MALMAKDPFHPVRETDEPSQASKQKSTEDMACLARVGRKWSYAFGREKVFDDGLFGSHNALSSFVQKRNI